MDYQKSDHFRNLNSFNIKLSKGLDLLDASQKGDPDISRSEAKPEFDKIELSLSRLQFIKDNWSALVAFDSQLATGPLYSSEEFGFGGSAFGRAYDASEIVGDSGMAGSVELRYDGLRDKTRLNLVPYTFYDIGKIWNYDDSGQVKQASGSSAGLGLRFNSELGVYGNAGMAWPLTRNIETPIYGQDKTGPRIILEISKDF
jgi:hemolysin activation/secretion protein